MSPSIKASASAAENNKPIVCPKAVTLTAIFPSTCLTQFKRSMGAAGTSSVISSSIGPRPSDGRGPGGSVEHSSRQPAPVCPHASHPPQVNLRLAIGLLVGLPIGVALWYALARLTLALMGGL